MESLGEAILCYGLTRLQPIWLAGWHLPPYPHPYSNGLSGVLPPSSERNHTRRVALTNVCYKPFGDVCAIQSVLQYWKMNRSMYEKEQVRTDGRGEVIFP